MCHFLDAFHAERRHRQEDCWALPPEKRLYYRVESYLFGVYCQHPTILGISSLARIDAAHPSGTCAMCLKCLIEEQLIPLCHAQRKTRIAAVLTVSGTRVFRELQSIFPGVRLGSGTYGIGVIDVAQPASPVVQPADGGEGLVGGSVVPVPTHP